MKNRGFFVLLLTVVLAFGVVSVFADGQPPGQMEEITGQIFVNGVEITAPMPWLTSGVRMLPLRPIAEALGYRVTWDESEKRVGVGDNYVIWIGRAVFSSDGGVNVREFGPAPEIVEGRTFVPMSMFNFGFTGYSARVEDGKILIDTITEEQPVPVYVPEPVPMEAAALAEVVTWGGADRVIATWYDERLGPDHLILSGQRNEIHVYAAEEGDVFALIRLILGTEFFAEEIESAKLYLKPVGETAQSLRLAQMTSYWTYNMMNLSDVRPRVNESSFILLDVTEEADGWVSLDITPMAKAWINGDYRNNGFAVFGVDGEPMSIFNVEGDNAPFARVTGTVGYRPLNYGRFGFVRVPFNGLDQYDSGNCLSFALRDLNMINLNHLGSTYEQVGEKYLAGGVDAIVAYIADLIEQYVADNAEALQISGFRRIDSFDSPIDPALEYRIALRVGNAPPPGMAIVEHGRGAFDYHLWVQINDGRWAQKFPASFSEIIVGTTARTDPGSFYWHMVPDEFWGWDGKMEYHNSRVIYFAVTKDVTVFTSHME